MGGRRIAFRSRIDQRHRLVECHRFGGLIGWQRRVDAVMADIGPIASVLGNDRPALDREIAKRAARIGAEAASARTAGAFLGDKRHRPIETDREHVIVAAERSKLRPMLEIGAEPADPGGDRLATG